MCREADHDTAMPAQTHGHDTTLARAALLPLYGAERAAGARGEQALALGRWALGHWLKHAGRAAGTLRYGS